MDPRRASRTAVLVCQGRAAAHGLTAPDRFADPVAMAFLREDERVPVQQVRAGTPPPGWAERMQYELVRATAEVVVPRTVAIDDAVRERPAPQLVILGAGLDGRAWRLAGGSAVFEVDTPASQRDKRSRVVDPEPVRFVPVELGRDDLAAALAAAGHDPAAATVWVWEGVVPYLTRTQVATTVAALDRLSAPGSRLVVNYQAPAASASVGRLAMQALTRRQAPLTHEPVRCTWVPAALARLLAEYGFAVVRDEDLLTLAQRLGLPVRHPRSLRAGRVAVADRVRPLLGGT